MIALLFYSREFAHRAHLATRSHAMHVTLGEFYEEVIKLADRLSETYQGRNGTISIPFLDAQDDVGVPVDVLTTHLKLIENLRYRAVHRTDTATQSQIDDVVNLYL